MTCFARSICRRECPHWVL